jgi:hypothetical protein
MKIKLIRKDLNAPPGTKHDGIIADENGVLWWTVGTVIDVDARAAELLVGNGDAEPADAEAEAAVGDWKANRQQVLLSRQMLADGVDPSEREQYKQAAAGAVE